MLILYRIYQILVMLPVLTVATILTAIIAIIGSALGLGRSWGYYCPRLWAKLLSLIHI